MVRIREMQESCKIVRQCLSMMPKGPVIAKVPRKFRPPAGECYARVEAPRGDMGFYVVSDGSEYPYRVKNSHRFLYGHEHDRQIEQGYYGRGFDRADRQSRCRCAGNRPLAAPIIMQAFIDQLIKNGAFAGVPESSSMRSRWC